MFLYILSLFFLLSCTAAGQFSGGFNLISAPQITFPHHAGFGTPRILPGTSNDVTFTQHPHNYVDQHPAVVENSIREAELPPHLLNPFYKNPAIASALAKESWFTNKEFPVHHREAERIPREEIFKIISRLQH
ncbi:unnamed protein product [Acanthoscelides obtectus]|uniref:Uncharacterized protein n=1 Tax=Acanthoscelides obtectus TaxID=200917 RepID=A0A9P0NXX8_ACAOB|nr:unnamed protein product [Acanthoscelides obtectus]CAK1640680.1 hypothetical protein AOBTE_LOCUS11871 [Acanthoscelides obtectus]